MAVDWPNAAFIGADPMLEQGKLYEMIGEYNPVALGAKEGMLWGRSAKLLGFHRLTSELQV